MDTILLQFHSTDSVVPQLNMETLPEFWRVPSWYSGMYLKGVNYSLKDSGKGNGELAIQLQKIGTSTINFAGTTFPPNAVQNEQSLNMKLTKGELIHLMIVNHDFDELASGLIVQLKISTKVPYKIYNQ